MATKTRSKRSLAETARNVSYRRQGLVRQGVSTRLVHSFRAVLEELETPDKDLPKDPEDILGEQITKLLNSDPNFQYSNRPSLEISTSDDNDVGFRPLLSWSNWQRLKRLLAQCRGLQWNDIKDTSKNIQQYMSQSLFWNKKSLLGSIILLISLMVTTFIITSASGAVSLLLATKISMAISIEVLMMIVDLRDVEEYCPKFITHLFTSIIAFMTWFDTEILQRKRFAGREWDKDDFVFADARLAKSTETSLWDLPPPSVKEGKRLCIDEEFMARDDWSQDTTKHIVGVDFCYVMLREEYLRKQASRRRKALEKEAKESSSIESKVKVLSRGLHMERKSFDLTTPKSSSDRVIKRDMDPLPIATSLSADDCERLVQQSSFTGFNESIEVIRERKTRFFEVKKPRTFTEDESKGTLPEDVGYAGINQILNDDEDDDYDDYDDDLSDSQIKGRRRRSIDSSLGSIASEAASGLNWMDVGAEIGIKLLSSAHVQRAMASQETAERILDIKGKVKDKMKPNGKKEKNKGLLLDTAENKSSNINNEVPELPSTPTETTPIAMPVHSMWTSPSAAATSSVISASSYTDDCPIPSEMINKGLSLQLPPLKSKYSPEKVTEKQRGRDVKHKEKAKPVEQQNGTIPRRRSEETTKLQNEFVHIKQKNPTLAVCMSHERDRVSFSKETLSGSVKTMEQSIEVVSYTPDGLESASSKIHYRRPPLLPGVKVAVPIFPLQPATKLSKRVLECQYQMATVVSSKRIFLPSSARKRSSPSRRATNCLSVTVKLDKSFLRNGEFAEMTYRVMDEWTPRYAPKHSKVPLGACVATTFGLGVLVSWRVEDDCHVVRSLWQRRGAGAAHAYLRRDAIHSTIEASVGFSVGTVFGRGKVLAYVDGGRDFTSGRYFVVIKEDGRHNGHVLELNRSDIRSCHSAQFIPVVEYIREAAQYQLQLDVYDAAVCERECRKEKTTVTEKSWRHFSKYAEILWSSFLRAIEEDSDFDEEMNNFMNSVINFLDRIDRPDKVSEYGKDEPRIVITASEYARPSEEVHDPGFWLMNDVFGGIFYTPPHEEEIGACESIEVEATGMDFSRLNENSKRASSFDRAYAIIRTLMRTVSIARAASADEPNFKLGLSICYEFLLFVKTIVKVQQKNLSPHSLEVWRRAWEEIVSTFGPFKERLEKIGRGIAERMEKQGKRAKIRLLRFVDIILDDDSLLVALEIGDWDRCAEQLEIALVKAKIIEEENREHYRKTAKFFYDHFATLSNKKSGAAARNSAKLASLALVVKWLASPRRTILKLFLENGILDAIERVLVRVFRNEEVASRMLTIHATNFHTLRHLRMLKDLTISGRLWIPLLDAADAEFSWVVSRMPENAKEFMCPLSGLFSLCVVQFHKISEGDLTKNWLDFLLEEDAVRLIHDLDMKLILALESFSRDVKEMMVVLPYYSSIDDDILNLMDEVDLDEFLKEAAEAIDDTEKLTEFIREKTTVAIERFLDYLPKMSIPVEKRDLGDGWMLTCHGEDGGDLTLSDVRIKRENLMCQVMGGDTLFFPMLSDDDCDGGKALSTSMTAETSVVESSILDHIRELLLQAQRYGCWQAGVGGVGQHPTDRYISSVLQGLPVSSVLNCAIELWRNLEIDDDELLEIAVRDVSYQIQLQREREEGGCESSRTSPCDFEFPKPNKERKSFRESEIFESQRHRFNPRIDPTVLFLEMKKLTLHLDKFRFRIEKHDRTIFDPVFEGCGSLLVQNVSIKVRVECVKERIHKLGTDMAVPVLQLRELDVQLEKVKLKVKDTGADWLLNNVVKGFSENITQIMETNLKEQITEQLNIGLENINSYFEVNPDLMLGLLGITMDDLEEKVVWV